MLLRSCLPRLLGVVLAGVPIGIGGLTAQTRSPAVGQGSWAPVVVPPRAAGPKAATSSAEKSPAGLVALGVELVGDANQARLALTLNGPLQFTVQRLTAPYRIIIDLPLTEFRLPAGTGRQGKGLVSAFRYGLFAAGKSRLVIDTAGPARVEGVRVIEVASEHKLEIELKSTTDAEFAAAEMVAAAQSIDLKPAFPAPEVLPEKPRAAASRPVIVIDPGHGGIDPGAQGSHGYEKDLVLAVATEIRRRLLATRRYEIVMTRNTDVFVSLDQRVRVSRQQNADLFLSLHADSIAAIELASSIRGATVYTLSDRASDERARRAAEKENAADVLAGLSVGTEASDGQVRDILFDLVRRETSNFSSDFRSLLVGRMRGRVGLAKDPARSAPFKVLRQPGSPAVLIELGYISNAEDEVLMASQPWQKGVAELVATAVEDYFKRRTAGGN